jgi:hypothetical protein
VPDASHGHLPQRQSAEHVDLVRVITATGEHGVVPRFHLHDRVYLARHTVASTLTVAAVRRLRKAVDAARTAASQQVRRARGGNWLPACAPSLFCTSTRIS